MGQLRSFLKDESAIAMIEYALVGSLVATATLIGWLFMGIDLSDSVDNIAAQL